MAQALAAWVTVGAERDEDDSDPLGLVSVSER
jgi:hypothetical protein